ncbi:DNA repair protein RAD14 KNAG_0I02400 [Huiozyma naganishii CBS 8797]|uniref:XPA C-terminal domain-containing protein n=1 Tax=Huiozyma naganishii (strain ATCC MYA-139 / BCRC 22969 / CBS 8797 / KCTC 17520 / NBRC 10181 / NCYC 3082 / Yp74L-3) TaxID=1071383 RepID=J7SAC0_HUIN7|nr:hypothetical protein KNAG_0I02400 [Kazachstania naganishii CBS 8797]CCK72026.1 hypothetical protein KNAG_0I02400 [Kazachstania naganishii CBS 8797]
MAERIARNRAAAAERLRARGLLQEKDPAPKTKGPPLKPSVRKSDYIDYDFATLENLNGGYISSRSGPGEGGGSDGAVGTSLEEWKAAQREKRELFGPQETLVPPPSLEDAHTMRRCMECRINVELDPVLDKVFQLTVCKQCARAHPEKYSLLTKTECKGDYLLTESELADDTLFHRWERANPHAATYARMQLFVRCEVERFASSKWGSLEALDAEWERRETDRRDRKTRKYDREIKQMRLRTRAQEFTKKYHRGKYGPRHTHEFVTREGPKDIEGTVTRRCTGCGLEVVEDLIE